MDACESRAKGCLVNIPRGPYAWTECHYNLQENRYFVFIIIGVLIFIAVIIVVINRIFYTSPFIIIVSSSILYFLLFLF